jgi:hypothetical protein
MIETVMAISIQQTVTITTTEEKVTAQKESREMAKTVVKQAIKLSLEAGISFTINSGGVVARISKKTTLVLTNVVSSSNRLLQEQEYVVTGEANADSGLPAPTAKIPSAHPLMASASVEAVILTVYDDSYTSSLQSADMDDSEKLKSPFVEFEFSDALGTTVAFDDAENPVTLVIPIISDDYTTADGVEFEGVYIKDRNTDTETLSTEGITYLSHDGLNVSIQITHDGWFSVRVKPP